MRHFNCFHGFVFTAIVMMASTGAAQAPGSVRYHLDAAVLQYVSATSESGGASSDVSTFSIGVLPTSLGFGIGGAVTDNVLLGARLALGVTTISPDEGDSETVTEISANPYLEFLLGEGDTIPFVGGMVGLGHASDDNTTQNTFGIGMIGGAHFMIADGASLDLTGLLGYETGTVEIDIPGIDSGEVDVSGVTLLLLLGVSGWS